MRWVTQIAVLVLTCVVAGCVSAQTFRSGTGQFHPPTQPTDVLVFYSEEEVKRPFDVIAEIATAGSSGWGKNQGSLVKKARTEAAKVGADAIILRSYDKGTSGDRAMAVLFGSNDKTQRVTAIKFRAEGS